MADYQEVRAKTGEDRDGKPFYKTIGRVLSTKNGPMLKLDVIPLGWDGWAYISEPQQKEQQTHGQMKRAGGRQRAEVYRTADQDSPPF
jgi:hypothetical protein